MITCIKKNSFDYDFAGQRETIAEKSEAYKCSKPRLVQLTYININFNIGYVMFKNICTPLTFNTTSPEKEKL